MSEDNWTRCMRLASEHDKDDLIRCLLIQIANMRKPRERRIPLWSFVGQATNHGSGVSSAICTIYSVNPDSGEPIKQACDCGYAVACVGRLGCPRAQG